MKYSRLMIGIAVCAFPITVQATIQKIVPDTLIKWMNQGAPFDFMLIDVRETSELAAVIATDGCRPYNLPYNTHVLDSTLNKLPKNMVIVLYCGTGHRSDAADSVLISKGFTMAYSLTGGITGWPGTTKPSSYVKPTSDLPAPSMLKTPVIPSAFPGRYFTSDNFKEENGFLCLENPLTPPHTLFFFNAQGKCMKQVHNPFSSRTRYKLPVQLSNGFYCVDLTINGERNLEALHLFR